jgi:DNA repair exonuclease SbcCD ATPase subunit
MIRTLVEIRDGRVSIQETADETTVTVTVDGAPSRSVDLDEVDRLNRYVRELGDRLQKRDTAYVELEDELVRRTRERDERERARAGLEKSLSEEIRKLRAQVAEYDQDRKTEQNRANQNKAWAERTETELEKASQEISYHERTLKAREVEAEGRVGRRDRMILRLKGELGQERRRVQAARESMTSPKVVEARENPVTARGEVLAHSIRDALRALEGPPSPPTDETSQA